MPPFLVKGSSIMFDTRAIDQSAKIFGMTCALLASSIGGAATQEARGNIGTLTCTVADAPPQPTQPQTAVGEERSMRCVYRPATDGPEQTYSGSIKRAGSDRLSDAKLVMIWVVWGPGGNQSAPGALAQTYIGQADTDTTTTGSAGLVGQSDPRYTLQASTPTGETNSTVTVVDLKLQSVPA